MEDSEFSIILTYVMEFILLQIFKTDQINSCALKLN